MERPSGAKRQSSFARSFFQSASHHAALYGTPSDESNTNANDDYPGFPVPRSRPASRASIRRRTGSSTSMSMAAAAAAAAAAYSGDSTDNTDDGFGNTSPYADLHQQGRTDKNLNDTFTDSSDRPEELTEGFGFDEVLEEYRIMAQQEARLRVKENIGFDMDEYENKNKAAVPTDNWTMYGGLKEPEFSLPEPKRLPPRISTQLQPEEPPLLPPQPNTKLVQQKSKRVPELLTGSAVRGGGPQSIPPDEHIIRCLGCRSNLRVNKKATLVICPDSGCKVISPASSTRM